MRFVVDEQLPPRLAEWLKDQGHEAEHVLAIGLGGAKDEIIHQHCFACGAVLLTKDADFAPRRTNTVPVVWLRMGNLPTRIMLERFKRAMPEVEAALAAGDVLVEVV